MNDIFALAFARGWHAALLDQGQRLYLSSPQETYSILLQMSGQERIRELLQLEPPLSLRETAAQMRGVTQQ